MARTPKPWFWADRQSYFVTIRGTRHNLGSDKEEADRQFHTLMAALPELIPAPVGLTVIEVFDKFLVWSKHNQEPRTFEGYDERIRSFLEHAASVADKPYTVLKPYMVVEWTDAHADRWGATSRRNAIVAVQRAFNWAVKMGHIDTNPIARIEKPSLRRRESRVTPEDWGRIKAHYPEGDPFIELLEFAWETGCRPQEAKRVEARHVDLPRSRVVFPPHEAKGKKRARVIHLTTVAAEVVKRLLPARSRGPLFVNADGNPWTAQAMACRFSRLKKHLGNKFSAYELRHGYCQRLLENGADHLAVAELMGHSNGKMVAEVYSHMNTAEDHLRKTLAMASSSAGA